MKLTIDWKIDLDIEAHSNILNGILTSLPQITFLTRGDNKCAITKLQDMKS